MAPPNVAPQRPRPPDLAPNAGPGGCPADPHSDATDALWQYLRRIESGLDQIEARIDRLYVALGGGTVVLASIGLVSAFIVRGG